MYRFYCPSQDTRIVESKLIQNDFIIVSDLIQDIAYKNLL